MEYMKYNFSPVQVRAPFMITLQVDISKRILKKTLFKKKSMEK